MPPEHEIVPGGNRSRLGGLNLPRCLVGHVPPKARDRPHITPLPYIPRATPSSHPPKSLTTPPGGVASSPPPPSFALPYHCFDWYFSKCSLPIMIPTWPILDVGRDGHNVPPSPDARPPSLPHQAMDNQEVPPCQSTNAMMSGVAFDWLPMVCNRDKRLQSGGGKVGRGNNTWLITMGPTT